MTLPVEKMKLSDKELNCMKMCQKAPKFADFSINPGEACPRPPGRAWHLQNSHSCILWIKTLTLTLKLVATTLSIGWNYFRCVKVCQVHIDPPRPSMASRLLRSHENISCFKYCHPPPPPPNMESWMRPCGSIATVSNIWDPDQARHFVWSDLGPTC